MYHILVQSTFVSRAHHSEAVYELKANSVGMMGIVFARYMKERERER
jgi:hypothetical protein